MRICAVVPDRRCRLCLDIGRSRRAVVPGKPCIQCNPADIDPDDQY